ncbi:MAG: hypothetical protein HONBIEJF_02440 [Fimbriimonadaceae bacterium]|nr:hypothetical protein [Fimbriimonadaceae bacterium]
MNAIVLAAASLLFGLGHHEIRRFERLATEDIRSRLNTTAETRIQVRSKLANPITGPFGDISSVLIEAENFQTDALPLFTEPWRSTKGKVGVLKLRLREFSLGKLRIQELSADIPHCRFDYALAVSKKQIRLSRSGLGTGYVAIREADLAAFALTKFREIKRMDIRIQKDKVMVDGYGEFIIAKTPFQVIADLESPDGNRLILSRPRIYFDWVRTDEISSQALLKTLNPLVDLQEDLGLFGAMTIDRLRLRDGLLEAWGRTKIPEAPTGSIFMRPGPGLDLLYPQSNSWLKKERPFPIFR